MVKIRLMRVGKKKQPSYRVVVADARSPRDGRIIEAIGHYHPRREPSEVLIDDERATYWIERGAQPSDSVKKLLEIVRAGTGQDDLEAPPQKTRSAIKATPAASVEDSVPEDEVPGDEPPAEKPEAVDQAAAAPEASTE